MATINYSLDLSKKQSLSEEQKKMLEDAEKYPIVYDEDCPEITEVQFLKYAELAKKQRESNKKQTISLRVSAKTMDFIKSFGKGYTTVLSKILDQAISEPDFLNKCLSH